MQKFGYYAKFYYIYADNKSVTKMQKALLNLGKRKLLFFDNYFLIIATKVLSLQKN